MPTINLLCPTSLHSWFKLRMCILDVGRKYMSRIFIYSSTFLGCYLFYAGILLLQYFDFIKVKLSLASNAYALFDILMTFFFIMGMLIYGASVN